MSGIVDDELKVLMAGGRNDSAVMWHASVTLEVLFDLPYVLWTGGWATLSEDFHPSHICFFLQKQMCMTLIFTWNVFYSCLYPLICHNSKEPAICSFSRKVLNILKMMNTREMSISCCCWCIFAWKQPQAHTDADSLLVTAQHIYICKRELCHCFL